MSFISSSKNIQNRAQNTEFSRKPENKKSKNTCINPSNLISANTAMQIPKDFIDDQNNMTDQTSKRNNSKYFLPQFLHFFIVIVHDDGYSFKLD